MQRFTFGAPSFLIKNISVDHEANVNEFLLVDTSNGPLKISLPSTNVRKGDRIVIVDSLGKFAAKNCILSGGSIPLAGNVVDIAIDVANAVITCIYCDETFGWMIDVGGLFFSGSRKFSYTIKTANYTASSMDGIIADTASMSFTVTLPQNPAIGDEVVIYDLSQSFDVHPLTVNLNTRKICGQSEQTFIMDVKGMSVLFTYTGADYGWSTELNGLFTTPLGSGGSSGGGGPVNVGGGAQPNLLSGLGLKYFNSSTVEVQPGEIEIDGALCYLNAKTQVPFESNIRIGESFSVEVVYFMYAIKGTDNSLSFKFSKSEPLLDRYGNVISSFANADFSLAWHHPIEGKTWRYIGQVYIRNSFNVATQDNAVGDSYLDSRYLPAKAFDNSIGVRGNGWISSNSTSDHWLKQINLNVRINQVKLNCIIGNDPSRTPYNFSIEVSADGNTWTQLITPTNITPSNGAIFIFDLPVYNITPNYQMRFSFSGLGSSYVEIGELQLFGVPDILPFEFCKPGEWRSTWSILPSSGWTALLHANGRTPTQIEMLCKQTLASTEQSIAIQTSTSCGYSPGNLSKTQIKLYFEPYGIYYHENAWYTSGYYQLILRG